MARPCTVCSHSSASSIDVLLAEGRTARAVARDFALSYDAVVRHARNHLATAGAAWYGAHYSRKGNRDSWYGDLRKPSFTPPDEVFPIVWTGLYALIAWSGWRVWCGSPWFRIEAR